MFVELPVEQIVGPTGALVLAIVIIGALLRALWVLWKEHLKSDADDRAQRDAAVALAQTAVDGTKRMADAWETRNRRDAAKSRRGDRGSQ